MKPIYQPLVCKLCGSRNLVRYGRYRGIQRWWCKNCHHKFADNDAIPEMRTPARQVASAINWYFEGIRLNTVSQLLFKRYNAFISSSSVYHWVSHFSKVVVLETDHSRIQVGNIWIVMETIVSNDIKDTRFSLIDILDVETRFLLASRLSDYPSQYDIKTLFEMAVGQAGKMPLEVLSDGWKGYQHGIESALITGDLPVQITTFDLEKYSTLMEFWFRVLNDRTKILRGLKKRETVQVILDGWRVHYNFFKIQPELNGKSPAEMAQANFKLHSWWDVIKDINQKSPEP